MPGMKRYIREHEEFVKERMMIIDSTRELRDLRKYHLTRIRFMQHERLIHLLVTLAFGLFMFIVIFGSLSAGVSEAGIAVFLILILLIYYIIHYYHLENGVQRWYLLTDEMDRRLAEKKNNGIKNGHKFRQ